MATDPVDEFETRFLQLFGTCIMQEEAQWLAELTTKFAHHQELEYHWTEEGIRDILGARMGEELHLALDTASPLLYKCLLRLSSFPYLDCTASTLTQRHLRAALTFIFQRHTSLARPIGAGHGNLPDSAQKDFHNTGAILFQSMTDDVQDFSLSTDKEIMPVAAETDESYLSQAYRYVGGFNQRRHPDNPKRVMIGPPIIPIDLLPPSKPCDYSGAIPRDQFNAWLRLLSSLNSSSEVFHNEKTLDTGPQNINGVGWKEFEAVVYATGSLDSLATLFTPFIGPTVDQVVFRQASREGALELLKSSKVPIESAKFRWAPAGH